MPENSLEESSTKRLLLPSASSRNYYGETDRQGLGSEAPLNGDDASVAVVGDEPRGSKGQLMAIPFQLCLVISAVAQFISASALSLYVIMDLDFQPVQLTHFWMYMGWAGWCSPLVGWVSDHLTCGAERRRPCIALGVLGNAVLWALVYYVPRISDDYWLLVAFVVVQTVFSMCVSVPLNALVVEGGTQVPEGMVEDERLALVAKLQSHAMVLRSAGSLVGSVMQTVLLLYVTERDLLGLSSALYLLLLVPLVLMGKQLTVRHSAYGSGGASGEEVPSLLERGRLLQRALKKHCVGGVRSESAAFVFVLLFVLLYSSMPDGSVIYFQYVAVSFEFPMWFLSLNQCIGLLAGILATALFGKGMVRAAERGKGDAADVIFVFGCVCSALGYATNVMLATGFSTETLGIPANVFVPVDNFFTSFMSRLAFMPVLQVAAARAPAGFEAFVYELFTVAALGGSSVSALGTAAMAKDLGLKRDHWGPLWVLLVACACCKLVPVLVACVLPARRQKSSDESEESLLNAE